MVQLVNWSGIHVMCVISDMKGQSHRYDVLQWVELVQNPQAIKFKCRATDARSHVGLALPCSSKGTSSIPSSILVDLSMHCVYSQQKLSRDA